MPDDQDYGAFFALVRQPERWNRRDRRTMGSALCAQRAELDSRHPEDRRRASLARIVADIDAAIAEYDATHPPRRD